MLAPPSAASGILDSLLLSSSTMHHLPQRHCRHRSSSFSSSSCFHNDISFDFEAIELYNESLLTSLLFSKTKPKKIPNFNADEGSSLQLCGDPNVGNKEVHDFVLACCEQLSLRILRSQNSRHLTPSGSIAAAAFTPLSSHYIRKGREEKSGRATGAAKGSKGRESSEGGEGGGREQ